MKIPNFGTLATKNLQISKGRDWRISPTSIWEILLTTDSKQREIILEFCQHLFSRKLLPSPDDLIIGFIKSRMLLAEPRRSLDSTSELATTWAEMVDDKRKTFKYDKELFMKKSNFLRYFVKTIYSIVNDEEVILGPFTLHGNFDITLGYLVREAAKIDGNMQLNKEEMRFYKISLFYAIMILCSEVEMENHSTKMYWEKLEKKLTWERIEYIVYKIPTIIWRGPFVLMAYMTLSQTDQKYSRGLWFDCLHSVYITYVDSFFTNDKHFVKLREQIPDPRLQMKIMHMEEMEFTNHKGNWLA